eukprot:UN30540
MSLLMVHLLKKFCSFNSSSSNEFKKSFSFLCTDLHNLGCLPSHVFDLIGEESIFAKKFKQCFKAQISRANEVLEPIIGQFWNQTYTVENTQKDDLADVVDEAQATQISRYEQDFTQLEELGEGGFGKVFKCQSRLDNRIYAVKRIPVKERGADLKKMLREVNTISRISAKYVLRYYWAWIE